MTKEHRLWLAWQQRMAREEQAFRELMAACRQRRAAV